MKQTIEIRLVENCWQDSLNWCFNLIDLLINSHPDRTQSIDQSISLILDAKRKIDKDTATILTYLDDITPNVKPVRNFKESVVRLVNTITIDYKGNMFTKPGVYTIYELLSNNYTKDDILNFIIIMLRNLENNWIALNQSYGRMIIKMKMNEYEINTANKT